MFFSIDKLLYLITFNTLLYIPLKKRLVFNFDDIKDQLIHGMIDNIEGITSSPKLVNGNQFLLLVFDKNFRMYGRQLNPFILMKITTK